MIKGKSHVMMSRATKKMKLKKADYIIFKESHTMNDENMKMANKIAELNRELRDMKDREELYLIDSQKLQRLNEIGVIDSNGDYIDQSEMR